MQRGNIHKKHKLVFVWQIVFTIVIQDSRLYFSSWGILSQFRYFCYR